jgi:hypothetical protein
MAKTIKIGRDAGNGQFIPVKEAERRPRTTVIEKIPHPNPPKKK